MIFTPAVRILSLFSQTPTRIFTTPWGGDSDDVCTTTSIRSYELVRAIEQLRSDLFNAGKGNLARTSLETWESFISYHSNYFQASACGSPEFFSFHLHFVGFDQTGRTVNNAECNSSLYLCHIDHGDFMLILCPACFVYFF